MKYVFAAFLFILTSSFALGTRTEQERIDSLEKILPSVTDTLRMQVLLTLCGDYMKADPEKVFAYADELTKLANTAGNWYYEAHGLRYVGIAMRDKGKYKEAGDLYLKSLKIFEARSDIEGASSCYNSLGALYFSLDELDKAEVYYQKCIDVSAHLSKKSHLASVYNNLGAVYAMQKKYTKALEVFNQGLQLRKEANDLYGIASSYGNLGRIYTLLGRFNQALEYQKKSLQIREELKDNAGVANTLNNVGEILLAQEKYAEATEWFNRGLSAAKEAGYQELIMFSYQALSECYEGMKDFKQAHKFLNSYVALKDSMMNIENRNQLEELTTQYETEKKEQQIKSLAKNNEIKQAENSRKQRIIYLILFVSVLVVSLLFVLIRMYNQKEIANQKLKKLDLEKNEFLNLAATDLKNPLSTIIGYCRMQADYFDKLNKENILKYSGNIKAAAAKMVDLISNLLDVNAIEEGKMKNNPERIDLNRFFDDIFKEFEQQAKEKNISFKLDSEEESYHVHADQRLLLQVTENLIAQSLKNSAANVEVKVKLVRQGNKTGYEVVDSLAENTNNENTSVLGLSIMKRMLVIMQADFEIKARQDGGAIFSVLLNEG